MHVPILAVQRWFIPIIAPYLMKLSKKAMLCGITLACWNVQNHFDHQLTIGLDNLHHELLN